MRTQKNRVTVGLLTALLLTGSLSASGQTQGAMNRTAGRAAESADAAMNVQYKKLMAVLSISERASLKKAQLAWLKYRDAEADFLSLRSQGGSVHPMVQNQNFEQITRQHTKELKDAYSDYTTEGVL